MEHVKSPISESYTRLHGKGTLESHFETFRIHQIYGKLRLTSHPTMSIKLLGAN